MKAARLPKFLVQFPSKYACRVAAITELAAICTLTLSFRILSTYSNWSLDLSKAPVEQECPPRLRTEIVSEEWRLLRCYAVWLL
jgi:hypothetical protein